LTEHLECVVRHSRTGEKHQLKDSGVSPMVGAAFQPRSAQPENRPQFAGRSVKAAYAAAKSIYQYCYSPHADS